MDSDQLGRDHLPNSDVRSFHAGYVAEDITEPRQHTRSHGPRLTLSGGWSLLPGDFGTDSAFGRGLMMLTDHLTVAYISRLSTLLTWPKIILSSVAIDWFTTVGLRAGIETGNHTHVRIRGRP